MQPLSHNEIEVRNRIRFLQEQLSEYSACSVVSVSLAVLAVPKPWTMEDAQAMPGLTLLLVKWAMQNPNGGSYAGKSISMWEFNRFRQRLWDLIGLAKVGSQNTYAMMRSLLPSQIEFQRRSDWGFMRWPSLVARFPSDHPSRIQFFNAFGTTPEASMDACLLLHLHLRQGNLEIFDTWLSGVPLVYRDPVTCVLQAVSRDFLDLRTELIDRGSSRQVSSWELFESPFAKRRPLLRSANADGSCCWRVWHPAMFERGLEDAVHLGLTHLGSAYTQVFSRVFEDHVVELAREMWPNLIPESQWKGVMGRQARSVEAILPAGPVNIFIEAKMSLFHDAVLIEDSEEGLSGRLERVIEAVQQGWQVSELLRQRPREFPRRAEAIEEYLLVVTNCELHLGGGLALKRLLPSGRLECCDEATKQLLPLENVFVLSIEAFEHLQQAVVRQRVQLVDLLREAKEANANAKTAAMYFDDHLKPHTTNWGVSQVVKSAHGGAVERLVAAYESVANGWPFESDVCART